MSDTASRPPNVLFILSDEHQRDVLGCYGNGRAQTPSLDALAARGTRFDRAYTNCPICVPARASLATGKYVHQIGNWDNAFPYHGENRSWHHELRERGVTIDVIGKLHFRSAEDDNGFSQEHQPLHVVEGLGDPFGAIRWNPPVRRRRHGILDAGAGPSTYQQYDISNADRAIEWLDEHAEDRQPWTLFLSFVCPHPPYLAPDEDFERFDPDQLELPPQWQADQWPQHPAYRWFRRYFEAEEPFDEAAIRNCARAYYALVRFLDRQIGRVLDHLSSLGLDENTLVIYTSDHGECLGARGLFGKFTHYEESVAVPLILAGPGIPRGHATSTPCSLLDIHATMYHNFGFKVPIHPHSRSLIELANEPTDFDRYILSEYHAVNSQHGSFMLANSRYKLIYHVSQPPQLFDLRQDPREENDLAGDPNHADVLEKMVRSLREICDPEEVDKRAKQDQRALIESLGGEKAVLERGFFENSPVPGEKPTWRKSSPQSSA